MKKGRKCRQNGTLLAHVLKFFSITNKYKRKKITTSLGLILVDITDFFTNGLRDYFE